MKELSIEEKAKAYDKALKVIKDNLNALNEVTETGAEAVNIQSIKNCFYRAFPELKESESEKIMNSLVDYFEDFSLPTFAGLNPKKILAWLKQQGEHANFRNKIQVGDKVTRNEDGVLVNMSQLNRVAKKDKKYGKQKPAKFKVGDWINGYYTNYKVSLVNNKGYVVEDVDGNKINILFENEKFHHLWTIQDAKDGDVLVASGCILIFEKFFSKDRGVSYCYYNFVSSTPQFDFTKDYNWYFGKETKVYPATKEQRDFLFQKMKEAGYEWDAEKKELNKIKYISSAEEYLLKTESKLFHQLTAAQQVLWIKEIEQAYNAGADIQKSTE